MGQNYKLDNFRIKKDTVVFENSSVLKDVVVCPYCGQSSSKVHSRYQREMQDLPMQNKKVILLVRTRKMFCVNSLCNKKTFAEKHPFVAVNGKISKRLEKNIIYTLTQLSSVGASKTLKSNGIDICKSSICLLLKKMPTIVDKISVKKICMDDFALRKRFSYGTVMVDLKSHKIIDMIASRNLNDVGKWLSEYRNVEIISRDGAQLYASAAEGAFTIVTQVSDRFHIIKGLSETIDKYLIRTYPVRLEIPLVSEESDEISHLLDVNNYVERVKFVHEKKKQGMTVNEIAFLLHKCPKTITKYLNQDPLKAESRITLKEEKHKLAVEQKQKDVDEARRLYNEGMSIEEIAKSLHHTYKTIQNYLNPEFSVVNGHYNVRIPNKLAPYEEEVKKLRSQGMTYPRIHKVISEKGYVGSEASLRMFMQKERIRMSEKAVNMDANSDYQPKEYVQRKALSQLIYKNIKDVYIINEK